MKPVNTLAELLKQHQPKLDQIKSLSLAEDELVKKVIQESFRQDLMAMQATRVSESQWLGMARLWYSKTMQKRLAVAKRSKSERKFLGIVNAFRCFLVG